MFLLNNFVVDVDDNNNCVLILNCMQRKYKYLKDNNKKNRKIYINYPTNKQNKNNQSFTLEKKINNNLKLKRVRAKFIYIFFSLSKNVFIFIKINSQFVH